MIKKTLAALAAVIVAGCATPVAKEASMDWPAFIASVPGSVIVDDKRLKAKYRTTTIKLFPYKAYDDYPTKTFYGNTYDYTTKLKEVWRGFGRWCRSHDGKYETDWVVRLDGLTHYDLTPDLPDSAKPFYQNWKHHGNKTFFCFDAQQQLMGAMVTTADKGFDSNAIIAFYTHKEMAQFVGFRDYCIPHQRSATRPPLASSSICDHRSC